MSMGHKEKLKSGDEYDALTKMKKWFNWRSKVRKRIKRIVNKRERKRIRAELDGEKN